MGKVESICYEKVVPLITKMGYEVVEVEYAKKNNGMNLTFVIYKKEGINVDDCEKVHKVIDPFLDEINPTNDTPYILNVESPGLTRPIKNFADFKRNEGILVEIKLYAPLENKKNYIGKIIDYNEESVIISIEGKETKFLKSNIASIIPNIKF